MFILGHSISLVLMFKLSVYSIACCVVLYTCTRLGLLYTIKTALLSIHRIIFDLFRKIVYKWCGMVRCGTA